MGVWICVRCRQPKLVAHLRYNPNARSKFNGVCTDCFVAKRGMKRKVKQPLVVTFKASRRMIRRIQQV